MLDLHRETICCALAVCTGAARVSRGCSTVGSGMLPVMMTVGKSPEVAGSAACAWHSAMAAAANKVSFMRIPVL